MDEIELTGYAGGLGDQTGILGNGIHGELIGAALDQPDAPVAP
jgi:hypothetical protein